MSIEIKPLTQSNKERWLSFCSQNRACWVHHKGVIFLKDGLSLSFLLEEDGRIVAVCPLLLEKKVAGGKDYNAGSLFGLSLPCPVVSQEISGENSAKKIKNTIYRHIFFLASENNVAKVAFNFSSYYYQEDLADSIFHELAQYGFLNASLSMALLDLAPSEEELWRGLSKGHRAISKKFIDSTKCEYVSRKNDLAFDEFRKSALDITDFTEPYTTYLYALYKEGHLDICNLYHGDRLAAAAVFLKCGQAVQYHAAKRFTGEDLPAHHLILWKSAQQYKQEGYRLMDLGVFSYQSQPNYIVSEKTRSIAVFKRGFGGRVVPFVIGERYFDPAYFETEYQERMARYKETIAGLI